MSNQQVVINKRELAPGIYVYSDVISGYETLIEEIEASVSLGTVSWQPAGITAEDPEDKTLVNKSYRDTDLIGIKYISPPVEDLSNPRTAFMSGMLKILYDNLTPIEYDYAVTFEVPILSHESFQILRYGAGQYFKNHIDHHQFYRRNISTVYYLNEDYSGGNINFPRFGISYKPRANEMIMFPSTYVYNHSVSEITEGVRYAIVSWIE